MKALKRTFKKREYGGIAQLGEHLLCKQGVCGSIPHISTNSQKWLKYGFGRKKHQTAKPIKTI